MPPELLQWVGSLQVGRLHLKDMYRMYGVKQICKECKNADICKILIDIVRLVRSLPCIALTSAQHVPPHQLLLPTEAAVPAYVNGLRKKGDGRKRKGVQGKYARNGDVGYVGYTNHKTITWKLFHRRLTEYAFDFHDLPPRPSQFEA